MTAPELHHYHHYSVYGQRISSNLELPHLVPEESGAPGITIHYRRGESDVGLLTGAATLLTRRPTALGGHLAVYEDPQGYLLRWEGRYCFHLARDGRYIRCEAAPSAEVTQLRAALYGVVLAFDLHLLKVGNLHSSAVALPAGAVGFMADPGTGKSTLAASFARAGHPFLSDDVLAVVASPGEWLAQPGFPSVSLSGNSLRGLFGPLESLTKIAATEDKNRLPVGGRWSEFRSNAVPLCGLCILNRSDSGAAPRLERLPRVEQAIPGLLANTSCLPILPLAALRQQLAFVTRLTERVPVWRLTYPSGFPHIGKIIEMMVAETSLSGSYR